MLMPVCGWTSKSGSRGGRCLMFNVTGCLLWERAVPRTTTYKAHPVVLTASTWPHRAERTLPPGEHGQAPRLARFDMGLGNIPGSKRAVKELLRFEGRATVLCYLQKKKPLRSSGLEGSARGAELRSYRSIANICVRCSSLNGTNFTPLDVVQPTSRQQKCRIARQKFRFKSRPGFY
jgi:hypothetical protein